MSSEDTNTINKEKLDVYLKELAKEYRRMGGKAMPAELILIGGAAIIVNYGFREMTTDIDAIIHAASTMKDAIHHVSDKMNLPNRWLNVDFMHTLSYSPKLEQYSVYYKNFYGVLDVRTIAAEYLIAMKLCSGRRYKNDLSDIIGILAEHEKHGAPISMKQIDTAVRNLYGNWDKIPLVSISFIDDTMLTDDFAKAYAKVKSEEKRAKDILLDFEQAYPGTANMQSIESILDNLKKKQKKREEILRELKTGKQDD